MNHCSTVCTASKQCDTICNIEWRDCARCTPYMPVCESTNQIPRDFFVDTRHNETESVYAPTPMYTKKSTRHIQKLKSDAINPETSLCFMCAPKQMDDTRIVWTASLGKGLKQFSSYVHENVYDKYFSNESVRSVNISQQ